MLANITPYDKLYTEAEEIQSYMEITPSDDVAEALGRGSDCVVYVARTGKMLADAKYHLNERIQSDVVKMLSEVIKKTPNASATVMNTLVKSICRDEQFLVDWIERLNNSCTKGYEWSRTQVSMGKEEMRLSNNSNGNHK